MSKKGSKQSTQNQAIYALCHKVKYVLPEDSLKLYSQKIYE